MNCMTKNCTQELQKMSEGKVMFRGVPRLLVTYYCSKCRYFQTSPELVLTKNELK